MHEHARSKRARPDRSGRSASKSKKRHESRAIRDAAAEGLRRERKPPDHHKIVTNTTEDGVEIHDMVNQKAVKVKLTIMRARFTDGTKWEP
ncbi:MAG: hypothetical protein IJ662_12015 [Clostridia bacterium]|nr:hypothetical protein [Clostridia bacterium]